MIEKKNYYHEPQKYYSALAETVSGSKECYELTLLDNQFIGMKILLAGNQAHIYLNNKADTVSDYMNTASICKGALPAICHFEGRDAFIEKLGGSQRLVICGAGHVSMSLIRIGKMTGFQVTVIDDRPLFCNNARMAGADEVICEPFAKVLHEMDDWDAPYFVVVTRGHQYDVDCMHEILLKKHSYIGMMGSKVRVTHLKAALLKEGFEAALLDSVHMPIGLSIGAQTPEEIAVSIMAEIIQCRHKGNENYHYSSEMLKVLSKRTDNNINMALAVIIRKKGSGPREAGTKMIVLEDGSIIGTIGGGCAEAAVIQKARYCMAHAVCVIEHVDMTGSEAAENGLICGGVMDVLIQPLPNNQAKQS